VPGHPDGQAGHSPGAVDADVDAWLRQHRPRPGDPWPAAEFQRFTERLRFDYLTGFGWRPGTPMRGLHAEVWDAVQDATWQAWTRATRRE
jgi:hypothetical protein